MARRFKTFGVSCHIEADADLIAWLESLPSNARSTAIRSQLRYALKAQGKLPTDYERGRNIGGPAPDLSDVKNMLQQLLELAKAGGFEIAQRNAAGDLEPSAMGFSDEAAESLAARLFGDIDEEE